MGTVNYGTSDYITLGIKPYDIDDFINDADWLSFVSADWGVDLNDADAVRDAAHEEINSYYESDSDNFSACLDKYGTAYGGFYYFHIALKPGYYEGLYIDIENNFPVAFDDWREKQDVQKELTKIRAFLRELAGLGFVECSPGWCTTYYDYKDTLKAIDAAVKAMRADVRATPTWSKYNADIA